MENKSANNIIPVIGVFGAAAFRIIPSVNRILGSIQRLRFDLPLVNIQILPLVMDIRQPTPECELNNWTILAATQRCKSELVMVQGIKTVSRTKVIVGRWWYGSVSSASRFLSKSIA